jgi:hypothetical protein
VNPESSGGLRSAGARDERQVEDVDVDAYVHGATGIQLIENRVRPSGPNIANGQHVISAGAGIGNVVLMGPEAGYADLDDLVDAG